MTCGFCWNKALLVCTLIVFVTWACGALHVQIFRMHGVGNVGIMTCEGGTICESEIVMTWNCVRNDHSSSAGPLAGCTNVIPFTAGQHWRWMVSVVTGVQRNQQWTSCCSTLHLCCLRLPPSIQRSGGFGSLILAGSSGFILGFWDSRIGKIGYWELGKELRARNFHFMARLEATAWSSQGKKLGLGAGWLSCE